MTRVFGVVVTYNRRALLEVCLSSLLTQTLPAERIVLVDNASTDSTREWIEQSGLARDPRIAYTRLEQNLGGAGGFVAGMHRAFSLGADAVWMMDDDAAPDKDALRKLMDIYGSEQAIYGSIAITPEGRLCWPLVASDGQRFDHVDAIPREVSVGALPFLGILIPRAVAEKIGYPETGYFLAGDDTEYCFRARDAGMSIHAAGGSRIQHPPSEYYRFGIGAMAPFCFRMPPWKRYYDVRNRILTMRRRGLLHVLTRTLPGTLLRLMGTLINEPQKLRQLQAYAAGTLDGLGGKLGMRHELWHIPR